MWLDYAMLRCYWNEHDVSYNASDDTHTPEKVQCLEVLLSGVASVILRVRHGDQRRAVLGLLHLRSST